MYAEISADASRMRIMLFIYHHLYLRLNRQSWKVARTGHVKDGPASKFYRKKVKASHTRHRALGPELIPVYRQSARRWP